MSLDYETLDLLRQGHPAWRLFRADNAPFVAACFQRAFLTPNKRINERRERARCEPFLTVSL